MASDNLTFKPKASSVITNLGRFLAKRRTESYLVGGYIRDSLINRDTIDIDIAVDGEASIIASEIANAFNGKYVLLDEVNKVARVILPQCYLDLSTMQGSIIEDLARRDFTIDAMAVDLEHYGDQVQVIDPFGGCHDLNQRLIRAVDDTVFQHDPARLLRAPRLAAELDFAIEANTESLIKRDAHLIKRVTGERVRDELCALLAAPQASNSLRHLDQMGLLSPLIPEITAAKGVEQPKEHFWDVFEHSIETVASLERLFKAISVNDDVLGAMPCSTTLVSHFSQETSGGRCRLTILKIAALLHDIGKPAAKTIAADDRMRFLDHAKHGASMAKHIMERLRFSSREVKMVENTILYHMRPGQLGDSAMPSHRAIYRYFRDTGEVGFDTLFLSLADHLATRGPLLNPTHWHNHIKLIEYVILKHAEEQNVIKPPKLIDGHDLINLGMTPGPKVGAVLEAVREAQAAGEIEAREQALDLAKKLLN